VIGLFLPRGCPLPVGEKQTYRFGPFEFDTQCGQLRKDGVGLKLQGQPVLILEILLQRPAQLVTREELRERLWTSDTFVDFDHSLNTAVKKLRQTLGDEADTPRYIETLPRRGYRFIGEVNGEGSPQKISEVETLAGNEFLTKVASTSVDAAISPDHSRHRFRRSPITGALALAIVVVATTSYWWIHRKRPEIMGRLPRIESIAVLPFENLSGDPAQEYFADGMTDELTTNLGKISKLRVISRTSVMSYKESRKPLPEIARELSVDAVVEGAVKRSGNHVHITANLLYAPGDRHLWACTYESELGDVSILQSTMARSIADEIGIKLLSEEQTRLARARPVNPDAYQAYLTGKYHAGKWSEDGLKKGTASFQQAIDLDPTYAPPYAGLAEAHVMMAIMGHRPSTEVFPLARAEGLKALEMDDGLAEAHADIGMVKLVFDWDWSGAEQEFRRAIALNPNSSQAHFFYGVFLTVLDRPDEAIRESEIALKLDPLSAMMSLDLGWVLYNTRNYDQSIVQLKKTLELAPDLGYANMELGWNYRAKGMHSEAVVQCQRAVALLPMDQVVLGSCGGVYGAAGRTQDAVRLLERVKMLSEKKHVDAWNVAWLYDGLGNDDDTMMWLERAYRERSASLYHLKNADWTVRLRANPRFQELLKRMAFPQ